jgi:hypothetical protein
VQRDDQIVRKKCERGSVKKERLIDILNFGEEFVFEFIEFRKRMQQLILVQCRIEGITIRTSDYL